MDAVPSDVILRAAHTHRDAAAESLAKAKRCLEPSQDVLQVGQAMEVTRLVLDEARDHIVRARALVAMPVGSNGLDRELRGLEDQHESLAHAVAARKAAAPKGNADSPFKRHRALVLGYNGTAVALQGLVLNCWGGSSFPVALSKLCQVDAAYRVAASEMLEHYMRNGENDKAFMALAAELVERRRSEGK